jgi:hypothetical protein
MVKFMAVNQLGNVEEMMKVDKRDSPPRLCVSGETMLRVSNTDSL